jgi:hypothetical protein
MLLIPKGIKVPLYSLITRSKVLLKIVGGGKVLFIPLLKMFKLHSFVSKVQLSPEYVIESR